MDKANVILMRYFDLEKELDIFLNGKKLHTFFRASELAYQIIELLKKLGYADFEKQYFLSRND